MRTSTPNPDAPRSWIDRVAGHIDDPVRRLRFLKAVAPAAERKNWWRPSLRACLVALAVLTVLFVLISLSRLRASERTEEVPARTVSAAVKAISRVAAPVTALRPAADVWVVEKSGDSEVYSNGLRIDSRFEVATHGRSYLAFPRAGGAPTRRSDPAGIVFHTTESRQAPFEPGKNGVLKQIGESLLEFIRNRQAYNFVIDRFGRVYRVVGED